MHKRPPIKLSPVHAALGDLRKVPSIRDSNQLRLADADSVTPIRSHSWSDRTNRTEGGLGFGKLSANNSLYLIRKGNTARIVRMIATNNVEPNRRVKMLVRFGNIEITK
jgi:hypothetical protein